MADVENGSLKNGKRISSTLLEQRVPKAKLLFSARLTLSLMCLFATWCFMFQRLTINFGLVCMVKAPNSSNLIPAVPQVLLNGNASLQLNDSILPSPPTVSIFVEDGGGDYWRNSSPGGEDTYHGGSISSTSDDSCPKPRSKNHTGSRFEDGDFEWSKEIQGLMIAAFFYGYVASQIPGGLFSDYFGAKNGLLLSIISLSFLTLMIPATANLGPYYVVGIRLLGGLVNGAGMPAISSLSSRWFADVERGFLLGIAYAGFGIATAVSYPISAFFCEYTGWPYLFYFSGGVGIVLCIMTYFLVFEWPEEHPRISDRETQYIQKHRAVQYGGDSKKTVKIPWVRMCISPPVWALLIANFGCFWLFLVVGTYLPMYFKEVLHLDISENGLLSSVPFVFMMFGHFTVGILFDNLRKRKLMSVTKLRKIFNTFGTFAASTAIVLVGTLACDNILGAVALITCSQLLLEFAFMGGYIFSMFDMAPKFASPLTSLMNTVGLTVGLIAPPLVSYLTPDGSREQWIWVFNISAGINAMGGLIYLLFGSAELQPWAGGTLLKKNKNMSIIGSGLGGGGGGGEGDLFKEKELKTLQIKLISGESDINGEIVGRG